MTPIIYGYWLCLQNVTSENWNQFTGGNLGVMESQFTNMIFTVIGFSHQIQASVTGHHISLGPDQFHDQSPQKKPSAKPRFGPACGFHSSPLWPGP